MLSKSNSVILELKSGHKIEFKNTESTKIIQVTKTKSVIRIEIRYNSLEERLNSTDKFRMLIEVIDVRNLPLNILSITFVKSLIKSVTIN